MIPPGDVRPAGEDLAVGRDPDLDARVRTPHGAEPEPVAPVGGEDGTRFRQPIPFQDEDTEGVEELGNLRRERRPAGEAHAKPPSEGGVDLPVDQPPGEGALEAQDRANPSPVADRRAGAPAHGDGPFEEAPPGGRCRLDAGQHARVYALEDTRHAAEEVGPHLTEILREPVEALRKGGRQSLVHSDERLEATEGVGQREKQQVDVPLADLAGRDRPRRPERGQVVPMRLDDALGRPGGPGRVDDRGHVVRRALGDPPVQLGAQPGSLEASPGPEGGPAGELEHAARVAHGDLGRAIAVHDHDGVHGRRVAGGRQRLRELVLVLHEERGDLRVPQDVRHTLDRVTRIDRNGDRPGGEDREVGPHPLRSTLRQDAHALTALSPERQQAERDLPDLLAQAGPGGVLPPGGALDAVSHPGTERIHTAPEQLGQSRRLRIGGHGLYVPHRDRQLRHR